MKYLIPFILTLCLTNLVQAKYIPTPLSDMIMNSEVILECRIKKVLDQQILIENIKTIKGELKSEILLVNKFRNWACGNRWTEYKVGQHSILFLIRNQYSNKWETQGEGNEGEMPIENNYIYCYTIFYIRGAEPNVYTVMGDSILAFKFQYEDCIAGINEFIKSSERINALIKSNKIKSFKTENNFLRRIIDEMIEEYKKK